MEARLYALGIADAASISLAAARGAETRPRVIEALADDGYARCREAVADIATFAGDAIRACLHAATIAPESIDAVVVATESFWDIADLPVAAGAPAAFDHLLLRDSLLGVLASCGLRNATPYGVWLAACGNCATALATANGLIVSRTHRRCLVVVVDKQRGDLPRFMDSGAAVLGDAAVAFVVDADEGPGFAIEQVTVTGSPDLAAIDPKAAFGKLVLATHRGVRRMQQAFEAATGVGIGDARDVIAGNFHAQSLKIICDTLGVPADRLRRDARTEHGHAYAADPLLTLALREADGAYAPGDHVHLLNTGVWTWAAARLRRRG